MQVRCQMLNLGLSLVETSSTWSFFLSVLGNRNAILCEMYVYIHVCLLGGAKPSPSPTAPAPFPVVSKTVSAVSEGTPQTICSAGLAAQWKETVLALSWSWKVRFGSWFANGLHWGWKLQNHVFFWNVDH